MSIIDFLIIIINIMLLVILAISHHNRIFMIMKTHTWFFFFIIIFSNNISGQNKTFKYDLNYKPNLLKDSLVLEKTILDIKEGSLSIFRTEQEKKSDSLIAKTGFGFGRKPMLEHQFYIIKKIPDNEVLKSIQTMFREILYIKIDEKLDWTILPEKDKIGAFEVQKATLNYGGRNWTAWFANEIPIQDGPYIFHGLPGLIVKISDDQNNFIFNLTEIKNLNGEIYYRTKGTEITWDQLKKMSENFYTDPLSRVKSMGIQFKKDDGLGGTVSVDMKSESERMRKMIRKNNNPVELNHRIDYK